MYCLWSFYERDLEDLALFCILVPVVAVAVKCSELFCLYVMKWFSATVLADAPFKDPLHKVRSEMHNFLQKTLPSDALISFALHLFCGLCLRARARYSCLQRKTFTRFTATMWQLVIHVSMTIFELSVLADEEWLKYVCAYV